MGPGPEDAHRLHALEHPVHCLAALREHPLQESLLLVEIVQFRKSTLKYIWFSGLVHLRILELRDIAYKL